ncbi:MAG: class I SAM-dependent methyltransferase [Candidatus Nitrosotenuis sp.]
MADFDEQWKNVMGKEYLTYNKNQYEYNRKRVEEFLELTGIKKWYERDSFIKGRICLDAGCGPGRWTYAMQQLKAARVDSFDISEEAINRCRTVNLNAYVYDIMNLEAKQEYDFVLSWGVLHHLEDTRMGFSKVASQVKKGGMLHIMVYNKENDRFYDGFRGPSCVEKHAFWEKLSFDEKVELCRKKAVELGGDIHGWFDAFNPKYNWSFSAHEVREWFEEEGFSDIKLRMVKQNINMNGVRSL